MLRAILVDDEPNCVHLLARQLEQYCPEVQVLGKITDSTEALELIRREKPDVVFLDIEMPEINGFQLLEQFKEISFSVIFVTAYDEFALKAFRFSALDYLLKPVDTFDLVSAVSKLERQQRLDFRQLDLLKSQYVFGQFPQKLAVPYQGSIIFVELKDIVYCESDSNYTKLILTNGKHHLLSKTLREVQEFLEGRNFLRVHRQYMVNLDHIRMYKKGEGNYLVMSNEDSIPVGRQHKDRLMQQFGWL
ncbi:MAG TPA: response regulator [Chryseolinea sp.]|nr:response regulator [Chryseolinea sp.]